MVNKIPLIKCLIPIYYFLFLNATNAQEKRKPDLEDLFKKNIFHASSVVGINWMQDGLHYTSLRPSLRGPASAIVKYSIISGQAVDTLIDGNQISSNDQKSIFFTDYELSADQNQVILASDIESIYRRSTRANFWVYNLQDQSLYELHEQKVSYATFSPDGKHIAYVKDNNLFYKSVGSEVEVAVTSDGEFNRIINGSTDWVYEEEFTFAKAFYWSPDSKKIAFYRFDESEVREYNMQLWSGLYPADYRFKYPKAGEKNSLVSILVYQLENGNTVKMQTGEEDDIYIPRIYWTHTADLLSIIRMNRLQNTLEILHATPTSGETTVVLTESSETFVDIDYNDNLTYLEGNKGFIRSSEHNGYKHIYTYKMNGELDNQITSGDFDVDEFVGLDEKKGLVYYISTENSPLQRQLYSISLKEKKKGKERIREKTRLSREDGVNVVNMNPTFTYYIQYHSSATEPLTVSLHQAPDGKQISLLEENLKLRDTLKKVNLNKKEFFTIPAGDSLQLNAYMIKPADFDATAEYPVLLYVYGGPGSQTVLDNFSGFRELWHSYLADQGYIVVSVDNRGTGARGRAFKHSTYARLGKLEVEDQITAANYLANQPYVDGSRIGIWGWSYGGYMSSLAIFLGNEIFKSAIAVAPVTNWRFYDTIYTERYLKRPQENASGYDDFSPITHADKLRGSYLLVHGTADDNVHFQNAVELQNALISAGKQFESFYYPNRNHGIYGGNTRYHLFQLMTDFVIRNL